MKLKSRGVHSYVVQNAGAIFHRDKKEFEYEY
jgi:hypothetical protein